MRIGLFILTLILGTLTFAQKPEDVIIDLNTSLLDSLVFEEVNKTRQDFKQPKLYWNESLAEEARLHSEAMKHANDVYYKDDTDAGQCMAGLLLIQYDLTYAQAAKWVVERWMNSPGHKKLLVNSFFTSVGVGSAFTFSEEIGIELKVAMLLKYE